MSFRTVVMPVAGLGTRFLPATKVQPKELMTLVDRPLIQFAVEEAVAAGAERIVLVSSPGKESVSRHFRPHPELERRLADRGKADLLALVEATNEMASVSEVEQPEPLGVGHAILLARDAVGASAGEAFGVMFPDDFIIADDPVMEQLRRVQEQYGGIVIAVERVPRDQVDRYGVISGERVAGNVYRVDDMVEKPKPEEAPSNLAVVGRYVLPVEIFDRLALTTPGVGGEIQITDAMKAALGDLPCHIVEFEGLRFDCGSKLGFVKATIEHARRRADIGPELEEYLAR